MIVDANVWVSSLIAGEPDNHACRRWLESRMATGTRLIIPTLALAEVAGAVARRGGTFLAGQHALDWVLRAPNLQIVPLNQVLGLRAAELAAVYRLRGADAVYAAVADDFELPLVTLDQEVLQRASSIVETIRP